MSIRFRVHLFQLIILLSVLTMGVIVLLTIRSTNYYLKRVEWASHQLEAITGLTVSANRFSEQIAELLLVGEGERSDLNSARAEAEAAFDRLEQVSKNEFAFLRSAEEQKEELDELQRIERMRTLFGEIDRALVRLVDLRNRGRQDEAVKIFELEIENRLDAEFENLLKAAVRDEREEVDRTESRAGALWRKLTWTALLTTLVALAVCIVAGILLVRSLTQPIGLLIEGTKAIRSGELDHRIAYDGQDEHGALARSFNDMAARQNEQRALLLAARSNLEEKVALRTDELEARTGELAAANQRLTDLDRMRVQFLTDIGHELRTPLTTLRGEAEITLRHGPQAEKVYRDALARIVAQSRILSRFVDDLLFLARSETDTIRFDWKRTALNEVVADAVSDGKILAEHKGIALEADCPTQPIWIRADTQRLKQALMIALDNAIKYSPPGRSVTLEMTGADGHGEVVIRDRGSGIPVEEIPHVFERFYRGRSTIKSKEPGSGLGLAIAKWLVEKHDGQIELTSEPGHFTEVRIRIPAVRDL